MSAPPLRRWLPHGWSQRVQPLDPVAVARWFWERLEGDMVWLDSSLGGSHLIGTGSERLVVDQVAEAAERLRTDRGPWVGWFGYEAGVELVSPSVATAAPASQRSRFPQVALVRLDRWVLIEPDGTTTLFSRDQQAWRLELPDPIPSPRPAPQGPVEVRARDDDAHYRRAIEACLAQITAGNAWVLCLTTAFEGGTIDAFASHLRLRALSPVPHGGLLRIAGTTLSSASMEQFLRVHDGQVTTSPIKGTRRRSADPARDAALARELATSVKERAENVMIVDLCRNDLGRVCRPGTVRVPRLMEVESYATVHQLVSTITGRLAPGRDAMDALMVMFPAGSMTGAPKERAIEVLAALETGPRGVYSGCFGVLTGPHGDDPGEAELAMVIRSVVSDARGSHVGVGGGITALSDPDDEVAEVHLKAEALRRCLVSADEP